MYFNVRGGAGDITKANSYEKHMQTTTLYLFVVIMA